MNTKHKVESCDAERLAAQSEGAEIHLTGLAIAAFCFFVAILWAIAAGGWWYVRHFPKWRQKNLLQDRTKIRRQRPITNDAKAERI